MESVYNIYKSTIGELLGYLLGGTSINYIGHRACVCGASVGAHKEQNYLYMAELARQKDLAGGQERNHLHRSTRNRS